MSLEWTSNPIQIYPSLAYGHQGVVRVTKSLGGGETRTAQVTITWGGESDSPAESVLFADIEALWDTLVTAGYTVTSAWVGDPNGTGLSYGFEKA